MGYHQEIYRCIRESYQEKYKKAFDEADRRTEQLHRLSPELTEIDRELSKTGAEIALAAIGTGEAHVEKLQAVREKNEKLQARRANILKALGYPADYTLPPYECPVCKDTGFVGTRMCDCMFREMVMAAYETSGLGQLLRTQSFENFDLSYYRADNGERERMQYNLELMRSYAEHFSKESENLILCGATGLGKTHLSTSAARVILGKGYDVYYAGAVKMFRDFSAHRFGEGEEEADDPARYTECDLLILDDLGTEVTNQFTNSCLYTVLNDRINLHRPIIINTNLTGKELQSRYTDRIASRILGEFRPLLFVGGDVRRKKLQN